MDTELTEVADGIYRISTFRDPPGLVFNQFLVVAEQPLIFHAGHRSLFQRVSEAVGRVIDPRLLRWVSFGHLEADECGAMNEWLAMAPHAQVVHGRLGVSVSLEDMADRAPIALDDGQTLDLGGKRVRWIDTPQLPHGWEAGLLFEETTATLFAGDLFTALGAGPATATSDPVEPALAAEAAFHPSALTARTSIQIADLADLAPRTLTPMHAPVFAGDCVQALVDLASGYERFFDDTLS
jgi:flavorubredoxin